MSFRSLIQDMRDELGSISLHGLRPSRSHRAGNAPSPPPLSAPPLLSSSAPSPTPLLSSARYSPPASAFAPYIPILLRGTWERRSFSTSRAMLQWMGSSRRKVYAVEEGADNEAELQALPYVLAVQAFCIVDPTLCTPVTDPSQFVVTLQPYLKKQVESKPTAQLLESIIFVIDAVLPLIRKPPHTVVEEPEQDLKQMIVRHSFLTVVHACIKCLSTLSNAAGRGPRISEYLVNIVYKHLNGSNFDSQRNQYPPRGRGATAPLTYSISSLCAARPGARRIDEASGVAIPSHQRKSLKPWVWKR